MKISIIAAVTIDGKIAKNKNHFPDWTGKPDKKLFADETKKAGAVIMGTKTFDLIGNALPDRLTIVMTKKLDRISKQPNLIFSNESAEKIKCNLSNLGYTHAIVCGGAQINSLFINKNLVDEIIITFSPYIFGKGISLASEKTDTKLALKTLGRLGRNSIYAKYQIIK